MATPFPPFDGSAPRQQEFSAAPEMGIDPAKRYTATMTVSIGGEAAGEIVIALDALKAPKTVNNFVFLALHKYFDGIIFHRIIPGFMGQGGDPTGSGSGNPGYKFEDELSGREQYVRGSVAMANSGPNTNGSQFFIVTSDRAALAPNYTLFGQVVVDKENVVGALDSVGNPDPRANGVPPLKRVVIESVTITVAD